MKQQPIILEVSMRLTSDTIFKYARTQIQATTVGEYITLIIWHERMTTFMPNPIGLVHFIRYSGFNKVILIK